MSGRELVILLLGLAIVAVVLRGLYVAINARRGQIKLAIDKNIPQDVDLESLELAELPGGGARVVTRSLEEVNRQNSALDDAEDKARSLNLNDGDDDSHIPVLMDAVELSEPAPRREHAASEFQEEIVAAQDAVGEEEDLGDDYEQEQAREVEEEVEEDFIPQSAERHSFGEDWEDDAELDGEEAAVESPVENEVDSIEPIDAGEETESTHSDYEEQRSGGDAMSSIAPDYDDPDETEVQRTDDESYEEVETNELDEDSAELEDYDEPEEYEEQDGETAPTFDADSSADEFSMTAGERIGGNPPTIDEENQSGLFDEIDDAEVQTSEKSKSGRSLFSLFGRKSKQRSTPSDSADSLTEHTQEEAYDDDPEDVLLAEEFTQLDIEEVEQSDTSEDYPHDEPVTEAPLDELDQKRTASLEREVEEPQESHGEEFEHSEVLVLNVAAKDGRVFTGDDLLHVLITAGLKFGEMNIFHKRLSKEHQGTVIFSVANMLNPGTFDLNNMDEFTTLGISFFLALPTPINNLDAFEQMLDVAQEIREKLDGDLKDDHRNGMTGQTIEHYRQRIRDFELRRLKAVAARG
ncbi:MAG: hypothetical protein DHS20C12_25520 [Pseudohongiella sp.]|nr:MAG: hypothetical protein DHS20C12_25520 [Pseudohongiella sp.]